MKTCPACQVEVAPFTEFTPAGFVERCPRSECGAAISTLKTENGQPATVAAPSARKHTKRATETAQPFNVVKAAKARLREVEKQLRDKAKLEKEAAQLKRLIAAAERPLASVKPIRANSQ